MASSSSKLLALTLTSSFLRSYRIPSSSLLPACRRRLPKPSLYLRFCSAASFSPATADFAASDAASASASASSAAASHPWPEWGAFLDKLRAKGYFDRPSPASSADSGDGSGDGEAAPTDDSAPAVDPYPFRDQNRVKNACLRFARDRFDLLSSLPKQDIQAVVECGCPNIFRKAVNSAKRLRAFLQVDEGDVCSACKLRGSCDKAYVVSKDEEGARTVDVVRILLTYAIDPTSLSGENSVDGSVQESARKLLSELIVLSDTTIDPSLPKPVFKTSSKEESSPKIVETTMESVGKSRLRSVGKGRETTSTEMKKGDWLCPNCNFLNFARNRHCLECKADGPKKIDAATSEMKMGDWICHQCHFMNFARNKICFKCEEPRPKRQLNPGEWECPSCDFVNFRRNKVCLKCSHDRPTDENQDNQLGYHMWRNTTGSGKSRSFDSLDQDNNDNGDDILPYEGERKFVVRERATPSQRRFTASRNQ